MPDRRHRLSGSHALAGLLLVGCAAGVTVLLARDDSTGPIDAGSCWGVRCERLNAIRADHGQAALTQRSALQDVADDWAGRLAGSGFLRHNPDLTDQVCCYDQVGENVGYGPGWRTVYRAFMDSPAHRANMLDPDWRQVGIGHAADPTGTVFVVLVFRDPR